MKAIRIHGPSRTSVDEIPVTEPDTGEVLVKVKACSFCGTDIELYTNKTVHIKEGRTRLPFTPGHEWAGVVERTGSGVTGFKAGDRVVGECVISCGSCEFCRKGNYNLCEHLIEPGIFKRDGGFAEYITFPENRLHKFCKLPFEEAALIEPGTVALYSVIAAEIKPMDNVMVAGPGPIGLLAVQILKNVYGVTNVILTGTRKERLEIGLKLGADWAVNIKDGKLSEKVKEITKGRMIDAVIETSGGIGVFQDISAVIRPRGRVVLVGFFGGENVPVGWDSLILREVSVKGVNGSPGIWDDAIEMTEKGKIQMKPLITHILRLDEFERGIDIIVHRKENVLKVVLVP